MAFGCVISLKSKIEKYLIEHDTSLDPSSREILEFAYKQVETSEEISKRVFGRTKTLLFAAVTKLTAAIESLLLKQIDSQSENEIHLFTEWMKILEEKHADELYHSLAQEEEEEEEEEVVSPTEPKMVGLADQYSQLKQGLTNNRATRLWVVSLIGMSGIGKTTLTREIFEDTHIVERFDCRVWVRVGRKCRSKEIPRRVLAEVKPDSSSTNVEKDEDVTRCLHESLRGKRYLIVLDDIWDKYMAKFLPTPVYSPRGNQFNSPFPDEKNGSRILFTSRLHQVDENNFMYEGGTMQMRLMNKEESWHLFREKVPCPSHELEILGRKIAEKCEGLPLTIVTVANLLYPK